MYRLIPDDMACYLNDDPYRTCAKNYGIARLSNNTNHLVYSPDPSTTLANICEIITKHTKVKKEEPPKENKEPTDFLKLAKYAVFHCSIFFVLCLFLRYLLTYSGQNDDQRTVALSCSLGFIIYCYSVFSIW